MTLLEKMHELEKKLQAIETEQLDVSSEMADHLRVFERVTGQLVKLADGVLKAAGETVSEPGTQKGFSSKNSSVDTTQKPAAVPVLLVEDNLVNRKLATLILERIGCEVDIAINGVEGVEKFKTGSYAAIFMDCQMPVMDGYTATRTIRDIEKGDTHIPIIAVTANALRGDREKCLECGMDDYIAKPIVPSDLQEAVSQWCRVTV